MSVIGRRNFMQQAAVVSMLAGAANSAAEKVLSVDSRSGEKGELLAGVATRDITPSLPLPLWGYSGVERNGESTLDPLLAKALVLRHGETAIAIVVLDMGRVPLPAVCDRIRARVSEVGVQQVVFTATHTHSGPYMELPDLPHLAPTEKAIGDAIIEANEKVQPAALATGTTSINIAHNRRLIKDGVCYMMWRNEERIPTSPADEQAGLLRIDSRAGDPIAVLVNYACHPVIFGPDSKQYSADWPGAMCKSVEKEHGGTCFFLQGAAGDINPHMDKTPIAEGAVDVMRSEGRRAGSAVLKGLAGLKPVAPDRAGLSYIEEKVPVGTRYDVTDRGQAAILRAAYGPMAEFYIEPFQTNPSVAVSTLLIGGGPAMVFQPGEFFVQFQLDLKTRFPHSNLFFCGYANDFQLYFPTIHDAAIGGYGASTATYVGLGAGERCVTQAQIQLGHLMGDFGPLTGPEDFALQDWTG